MRVRVRVYTRVCVRVHIRISIYLSVTLLHYLFSMAETRTVAGFLGVTGGCYTPVTPVTPGGCFTGCHRQPFQYTALFLLISEFGVSSAQAFLWGRYGILRDGRVPWQVLPVRTPPGEPVGHCMYVAVARSQRKGAPDRLANCKGCPLGAEHAGEPLVLSSPLYERRICSRCHRPSDRLINDEHCPSCYTAPARSWWARTPRARAR